MFTIELGSTRTIDNSDAMAKEISRLKQEYKELGRSPTPLSFPEFSHLVSHGVNTRLPSKDDHFLYRGDFELSKSDSEIQSKTTLDLYQCSRLASGTV